MFQPANKAARWQAAQQAELTFWRQWRSIPTYRDLDQAAYWRRRLEWLDLSEEALRSQTVVEVGCGPIGMIFHFPACKGKIALDPLLDQYVLDDPTGVGLLRAVGEQLPLRDECADFVICHNVIDHVMEPEAVLREIRRILRPGALAYFMAHSFPAVLCPFLGFDTPHPYHWSVSDLLALVQSHGFRIERHVEEPVGLPVTWRGLIDPRTWKHVAVNWVVSATHLTARRDR